MKQFLQIAPLLFLFACTKSTKVAEDIILCDCSPALSWPVEFGTSYGFCTGNECVTRFIIETETRSISKITSSSDGQNRDTIKITDTARLRAVAPLFNQLPAELLQLKKDTAYGCPDCADQGATFIYINNARTKNKRLRITFDNTLDNNPEHLRNYIRLIWDVVEQLK